LKGSSHDKDEQDKRDHSADCPVGKAKKLILFGSYARGNQSEDSNLDLMVIVENSDLLRHKSARTIRQHLRGITDVPRNILVYTQNEIDEWASVKLSFVSNILQAEKPSMKTKGERLIEHSPKNGRIY